jgi:hypothetical protein
MAGYAKSNIALGGLAIGRVNSIDRNCASDSGETGLRRGRLCSIGLQTFSSGTRSAGSIKIGGIRCRWGARGHCAASAACAHYIDCRSLVAGRLEVLSVWKRWLDEKPSTFRFVVGKNRAPHFWNPINDRRGLILPGRVGHSNSYWLH